MKTLLFCTGYCSSTEQWEQRIGRWINAAESGELEFDTILIPDDGSPVLPEWPGVEVIHEGSLPEVEPESRGVIYHFAENLGRSSLYVYPGWYRSFMFAAEYAKTYGYEKVIHIESDAYVISERMNHHLNQFSDGWETYWCLKYQLPETAIQVIAGSALVKYYDISTQPYANFSGRPPDPGREQGQSWLPYTVNKDFYGDRWGENNGQTPKTADYTCQIELTADCWWIDG